jgi:hypothetical protein
MSLSRRQRRLLSRIDDAVGQSDSRLASMLAVFGELAAGEELPGHEQLRTPRSRVRTGWPPAAAAAIAMLITRAARGCARAIYSAEAACLAACIAGGYEPAAERAAGR